MTNRWNWLKDRLVTINSNPSRFAKDINWQASRVYELFSGKTKAIPLDKIAVAAARLGVRLDSMINFNSGQIDEVQLVENSDSAQRTYYSNETIPEVDAFREPQRTYSSLSLRESGDSYNDVGLENKEVVSNWKIPDDYLKELKLKSPNVYIFEAIGDSMAPTICAGDKLIVDTSYRGKSPSPAGIYAIWDSIGICVKRLELIPNTIPQRVIISSDNSKQPSFERKASECCVVGRVAGVIKRL